MRAVLFDKDGTLMQFSPFWVPVADRAFSSLAARLGAPQRAAALKEAVGLKDGSVRNGGVLCAGTYAQMALVVRRLFPERGAQIAAEEMKALFLEFAGEGEVVPTCKNMREMLISLRRSGLLLFAVTTDFPEITRLCLAGLQIFELFEEVYCDDGVHPAKPDPAVIREIAEKYGFSPREMCMVGDTATDIAFARAGGIRSICVGSVAGADDYLDDVSALPALLNAAL